MELSEKVYIEYINQLESTLLKINNNIVDLTEIIVIIIGLFIGLLIGYTFVRVVFNGT